MKKSATDTVITQKLLQLWQEPAFRSRSSVLWRCIVLWQDTNVSGILPQHYTVLEPIRTRIFTALKIRTLEKPSRFLLEAVSTLFSFPARSVLC